MLITTHEIVAYFIDQSGDITTVQVHELLLCRRGNVPFDVLIHFSENSKVNSFFEIVHPCFQWRHWEKLAAVNPESQKNYPVPELQKTQPFLEQTIFFQHKFLKISNGNLLEFLLNSEVVVQY